MQQQQTYVHNKIDNNTKQKQKTKATFGRLLRHPAWKRNGPTLKELDRYRGK